MVNARLKGIILFGNNHIIFFITLRLFSKLIRENRPHARIPARHRIPRPRTAAAHQRGTHAGAGFDHVVAHQCGDLDWAVYSRDILIGHVLQEEILDDSVNHGALHRAHGPVFLPHHQACGKTAPPDTQCGDSGQNPLPSICRRFRIPGRQLRVCLLARRQQHDILHPHVHLSGALFQEKDHTHLLPTPLCSPLLLHARLFGRSLSVRHTRRVAVRHLPLHAHNLLFPPTSY